MIENGREFGAVHRCVWEKMLEIARQERVEDGGMLDPRIAAINLWAGPEDRPEGQDFEIVLGVFPRPRAYHSGLYAEYRSGVSVSLILAVSNYEHGDHIERTWNENFSGLAKQMAKEAAIRGYESDWKWAREKFEALVSEAEAKTAQGVAG
jgi:hypothetical protein